MDEYEEEIRLIDYLNVIWKRKWLIIMPTFLFVIIAGIYSFLQTPVWEISGIIQPSKSLIHTVGGRVEEILYFEPMHIANLINQSAVNSLAAAELNLNMGDFPNLEAKSIPDTKLIRLSIREEDVEMAKSTLRSFFEHLKKEFDIKANLAIKEMDSLINANQIEKARLEKEIEILKGKVKSIGQRRKGIEEEIIHTEERIDSLKKEQKMNLEKKNRKESENLGILLSSNEIQQSITHIDTLKESLSAKILEEADINLIIEEKTEKIKQLDNSFENLKEKKGHIKHAKILEEAASSPYPVSPRKGLNIMIAGILGIMIFTLLAFFFEYLKNQKTKNKE